MSRTYTRNGMGNVSTTSGIALPEPLPAVTDYTIAADSNRLTDSLGPKNRTFTHDGAGNITSDGARDFVYNQNNRLVRVEAGGTVLAEYAYDGFERRVKKVAGGTTVHYHYDLNSRLIAETDGAGNPIRDYVYIDGEPVAMQVYGAGAGWYWFLNDHLGTPQKLVDSAGAVVWQAAYMPFGDARILTADIENNLRFPGQYYDAETGLHYNWHRYYDPEIGRYLRPDPIGLDGGINLFAYVQNDPINVVDPYGLDAGIISGPAAYFVAGAIAGGILYYGAPIAEDIGKWLGEVLWNENTETDDNDSECQPKRSPYPPAKRDYSKSKKDAYEKAKRAGKGNEPIHHPDGDHGPHYHPDVPMPKPDKLTPKKSTPHDHYYYPKR